MKTTLNVEGMSCEHCVRHVTDALQGLNGVKSAKVNLRKKTAVVEHGETVTLDEMKAAIKDAGYEVTE